MSTHSRISCLKNPMDGGACGLQSMGLQRVRRDRAYMSQTVKYKSGF